MMGDTRTARTMEVLANYAASAAEAMAYTLMRTAHSTFVKETEDFSCGLLTPEGVTFASPTGLGATWYIGLDYGTVISRLDDYRDGDICITNDPYSGFVATHTPDMHIWKPVFYGGELVGFVAGHIHNTDMGGAVPASLSRTLTDVQQEGLRIPPTKLVSAGKVNQALLGILRRNVRAPEQNLGDLNAQIASVAIGERKMLEMVERFGLEAFREGMYALLDYAEAQARAVVREIPDGTYFFADYADEDSDGGVPCRIAITLTVAGEELILDFTGSDPQLQSSLNVPTGGRAQHVLPSVGVVYVLYTLNPRLLLNAGILRVCRCVLPEGSIVNPVEPAAVGMRSLTCNVIMQTVFGVFSQAVPSRLAAAPAGGLAIINVKTMTPDGRPVMASIGPIGGGAGGTPCEDGAEGSGANTCYLRNTPVEVIEAEVPIHVHRYGLAPDSGGAGRHRGGCALLMEFQVFAPNTVVTARNRDRTRFAAWGVLGGRAGATSRFTRNPDGDDPVELDNADLVKLDPGDVLRVLGPGAGGHGPPESRDPAAVLDDVLAGLVSVEAARRDYGVALVGGEIDSEETERLRGAMRERRPQRMPHFDFGHGRLAFEAVMTPERYDVLTRILSNVPVGWRFYLKHRIFSHLFGGEKEEVARSNGSDAIIDIYRQIQAKFSHLPRECADRTGCAGTETAREERG